MQQNKTSKSRRAASDSHSPTVGRLLWETQNNQLLCRYSKTVNALQSLFGLGCDVYEEMILAIVADCFSFVEIQQHRKEGKIPFRCVGASKHCTVVLTFTIYCSFAQ